MVPAPPPAAAGAPALLLGFGASASSASTVSSTTSSSASSTSGSGAWVSGSGGAAAASPGSNGRSRSSRKAGGINVSSRATRTWKPNRASIWASASRLWFSSRARPRSARKRDLGRAAAHALLLDRAQHVQRRRFGGADMAGAAAMRAGLRSMLRRSDGRNRWRDNSSRPNGLMRPDLDAGPVVAHRVLQPALDRAAVAVFLHVDEVDRRSARRGRAGAIAARFPRRLRDWS